MDRIRTLILGAAGRDFHNVNVVYRDDTRYDVVGFTAAQIPNIAGRRYPPELADPLYPQGVPIFPEDELAALVEWLDVRQAVFSYSDVSYHYVMHRAAVTQAAGAGFVLLGPRATMLDSRKPVAQRVQRFTTLEDMKRQHCTIEEMEEYEPHIVNRSVVYAGVDYGGRRDHQQDRHGRSRSDSGAPRPQAESRLAMHKIPHALPKFPSLSTRLRCRDVRPQVRGRDAVATRHVHCSDEVVIRPGIRCENSLRLHTTVRQNHLPRGRRPPF